MRTPDGVCERDDSPPSGSTAVTHTTAAPASSDAARSTSALIPQSWSPAGSSRICRTRQRLRLLVIVQQRRARARRRRCRCVVVLGAVRLHRVGPALGVPAGRGVQLAELVAAAQRGQLDPAEHRVADEHAERPRLRGDRRRPGPAAPGRPRPRPSPGCAASPTRPAGWSRPGGPARPATRRCRPAPRSWPRPARSGAAPGRRRRGSAAPGPRCGRAGRSRRTRRRSSRARTCRGPPTWATARASATHGCPRR